MKKLFKLPLSVLTLLVALLTSMSASAQVDLGEMELGKRYQLQMYKSAQGRYTPESDGLMTLYVFNNAQCFRPYRDAEHTMGIDFEQSYGSSSYLMTFEVEQGETVYFYDGFIMNDCEVMLEMNAPLKVEAVYPDPATTELYSYSSGGDIQIQFNRNIAVNGNKNIFVKDKGLYPLTEVGVRDNYVNIDMYSQITRMVAAGTIEPGDQFTIILDGICSANDKTDKYGDDGSLTLTYILASIPAEVKSWSKGTQDDFRSYYMPDDPNGKLVLTFDKPVDPQSPCVEFVYGDLDAGEGEYYIEEIPYTFNDDATVMTADFSGKLRRAADMSATGSIYQTSVKVSNMRDADGQYVYTTGVGTLGSISFSWPLYEVLSNVSAQFTPASGSSIANTKKIEVFVLNYDDLKHDGLRFEWNNGKHDIATADMQFEDDPDGKVIMIDVPEEVRAQKDITLSFINPTTPDGIDHSNDLRARYNVAFSLRPNSCVPARGESIGFLAEGSEVSISVNKPDVIGFATVSIIDVANPDEPSLYNLRVQYNGDAFVGKLPYNLYFYLGHTYRVVFNAWSTFEDFENGEEKLGSDYYEFNGSRSAFVASSITLDEVTPADMAEIPTVSDGKFDLTFSGFAAISKAYILDANGTKYDATVTLTGEIQKNEDSGRSFSRTITLLFTEAQMREMTKAVTLYVYAFDEDGHVIAIDEESANEDSYFEFHYTLPFASGVESIVAGTESETVTVYTLGGVQVLKDADRASLGTLTPGVYVVNGAKVLVK